MSIPALNAGMQGIQTGMDQLRRDANEIARAGTDTADDPAKVADALVNLKQDQQQVQASAKVVNTVQDLLGQLIDEMA